MKVQAKNSWRRAGWLLFYLYIIMLAYFLFFSEHYGRDYILEDYRYNLEFLKEIKRFIRYRELLGLETFIVNIMGNILAFAPFGFLLPLLNTKYRHFFYIMFLSLLFSLTVELMQLFLKVGIFDVDDLLLNTIGGVLGYLFFAICNAVINGIGRKKKKKRRS
ncbi:VanZ family protein [Lachnospiraceae bacterium MD1]|uniref:VanZ family protein n=1 Tax=Variimorphobacter saccharofermentans TaxID=2755051 RepID=A0A839K528_9FIRM|nr:VanZ family protein [Variimorphobacter saccharofermentans]MBB2184159.1 VanZ family protein [Variimorphobacter saccharofermentans]